MKTIFLATAVLLSSASVASAQSQPDTTQTQSKSWQSGPPNYQNYPTKDMRKLNSGEIPDYMRTTLQGKEYSGWENGSVYFNSSTNEYFYQPGSNSATSVENTVVGQKKKVTWYRFDSKGRPLKEHKPGE